MNRFENVALMGVRAMQLERNPELSTVKWEHGDTPISIAEKEYVAGSIPLHTIHSETLEKIQNAKHNT